jgi:NADPH-dependent 2,4-dienoyl-CoA reductase/sulfur reductase-like enzyme
VHVRVAESFCDGGMVIDVSAMKRIEVYAATESVAPPGVSMQASARFGTESSAQTKLIVGGGLGGLATALALSHRGIGVRVLEGDPRFGTIGDNIQFGPNVFARASDRRCTAHDRAAVRARTENSALLAHDISATVAKCRCNKTIIGDNDNEKRFKIDTVYASTSEH